MTAVRADPERFLTEALTGWRRVDGAEGWLLDHRATYSTDPRLPGPGGSLAVPGATWLATLAVSRFGYSRRSGVDDGPALPEGWFRAGDRDVFLWPLWTLPADPNTLRAVWNVGWGYDSWKLTAAPDGALRASIARTHGVRAPNAVDYTVDLDIFTMCAAARPPGGGALTPEPAVVERRPSESGREYAPWKGWDGDYPDPGDYPGRYGWG